MLNLIIKISVVIMVLNLIACGSIGEKKDSAPSKKRDVSSVPNAIPKDEPRSKYGNPAHYEVFGKTLLHFENQSRLS